MAVEAVGLTAPEADCVVVGDGCAAGSGHGCAGWDDHLGGDARTRHPERHVLPVQGEVSSLRV